PMQFPDPSAARECSFEVGEFAEDLEARFNLVAGQRLKSFRTEALYGERSHHAAVEQRPLEHFAVHFALRRDVSHEAAGKRITSSGGILYLFDWQGRSAEWMMPDAEGAFAEEDRRAILSVFDDQRTRSHREHFLRSPRQVGFIGDHLR